MTGRQTLHGSCDMGLNEWREADPRGTLVCFSIHGAGITGSISNFFYRLTSLEPSAKKRTHTSPVLGPSGPMVGSCLFPSLIIFDPSNPFGMVHVPEDPHVPIALCRGHLTPRWLEGVTRGGGLGDGEGDTCDAGYDRPTAWYAYCTTGKGGTT